MGNVSGLFNKYRAVYSESSSSIRDVTHDQSTLKKTRLYEVRVQDNGDLTIKKRGDTFAGHIFCWLQDFAERLGIRRVSKNSAELFLTDIENCLQDIEDHKLNNDNIVVINGARQYDLYRNVKSHAEKGRTLRAGYVREVLQQVSDIAKREKIQIPVLARDSFQKTPSRENESRHSGETHLESEEPQGNQSVMGNEIPEQIKSDLHEQQLANHPAPESEEIKKQPQKQEIREEKETQQGLVLNQDLANKEELPSSTHK